jgi:L-ascorbate metabolism protein UlaG (beta-lactamase superfamily)
LGRVRRFLLLCAAAGCAAHAAARPPLTLTYLGVAGWTIADGNRVIVSDPYFSRPADPFHGAASDPAAVKAHAPPRADLILVGHGHVDHALDVPAVAQATGAPILAAPPVLDAAHDAGVPDKQLVVAQGGDDYAFDGFSVRVIPSLHSAIGLPAGGDVATFAYLVRLGGRRVLVFDTANFIERELEGLHPDIAIVAPGLRERITDYACRLMRVLGSPPVVLATHFDDWRGPAGAPLDEDTRNDLAAFAAEIHRCAPRTAGDRARGVRAAQRVITCGGRASRGRRPTARP